MVLTMFLLGLLYVVFMAVLIAVGARAVVVLVIAAGFLLVQYFFSDRIALYAMGGREVSPQEAPQLHAVIDRLSALADMPNPAWPSPTATCPTRSPPGATRRTPSSA